jgi:AraC-like DNA-binding protein
MNERGGLASVDPLGDALQLLRMTGIFYCRTELTAPWGLVLPAMPATMSFQVVTAGQCWLSIDGAAPSLLRQGELALVPHGDGHRLMSAPGVPGRRIDELAHEHMSDRSAVLRYGGGGAPCSLVCGAVRLDHPAAHHLVALLPRFLHIQTPYGPELDWIQITLRLMAVEADALRPGGDAVITRLADILVIQSIRSWIQHDQAAQVGWLGALRDKQIGRAIALIHRDPARAWTLAELASEVAMSRSRFAARFTALVGEPAMHYVARWRMQVALTWLRQGDDRLAELAIRLGYQSEAAFSRAFKRYVGVSPGSVRRARSVRVSDDARAPRAPDGRRAA